MLNLLLKSCCLSFIARPGNSMDAELLRSSSLRGQRDAFNLVPALSLNEICSAVDDPVRAPRQPIPTDVPVGQPVDVPVREPHDVPPAPQPERPERKPSTDPGNPKQPPLP